MAMFFERHGMPAVSAYLMETFQEHVDHHTKCYDLFNHEEGACGLKNLTIKGVTELMLAVVPALIAFHFDWITSVMMFGAALVHAYLWSTFHSEMHRPQGTWFSKTRIFQFLARYHFLHHRHMNTNYNVIFVGWDWILFTAAKENADDREAMQHEHWRVRPMRRKASPATTEVTMVA